MLEYHSEYSITLPFGINDLFPLPPPCFFADRNTDGVLLNYRHNLDLSNLHTQALIPQWNYSLA